MSVYTGSSIVAVNKYSEDVDKRTAEKTFRYQDVKNFIFMLLSIDFYLELNTIWVPPIYQLIRFD